MNFNINKPCCYNEWEMAVLKRLFLMIIVFLFPYFGFADSWIVLNTNKVEYLIDSILHETDTINIQEGEYLMIWNVEKRQLAIIIIPGEKTLKQGIEEAKMLEQERRNTIDRNRNNLGEPTYLFLLYPDHMPFWIQE